MWHFLFTGGICGMTRLIQLCKVKRCGSLTNTQEWIESLGSYKVGRTWSLLPSYKLADSRLDWQSWCLALVKKWRTQTEPHSALGTVDFQMQLCEGEFLPAVPVIEHSGARQKWRYFRWCALVSLRLVVHLPISVTCRKCHGWRVCKMNELETRVAGPSVQASLWPFNAGA